MAKLAPSILSADSEKFAEQLESIKKGGASFIHYDVMDGVFVPAEVYPMPVKELSKITTIPIDVHLMVKNPIDVLDQYVSENTYYITVHYEACDDLPKTIEKIHSLCYKAGIAINPDTPISVLKPYFNSVELILIMSVVPGKAGQGFISSTMIKLCELDEIRKANNYAFRIEVDGGIKLENAQMVKNAGSDIIVAGSGCFGASDIKKRCEDFNNLIK